MDMTRDERILCRQCGRQYRWNPHLMGRLVRCKCAATLRMPHRPDFVVGEKLDALAPPSRRGAAVATGSNDAESPPDVFPEALPEALVEAPVARVLAMDPADAPPDAPETELVGQALPEVAPLPEVRPLLAPQASEEEVRASVLAEFEGAESPLLGARGGAEQTPGLTRGDQRPAEPPEPAAPLVAVTPLPPQPTPEPPPRKKLDIVAMLEDESDDPTRWVAPARPESDDPLPMPSDLGEPGPRAPASSPPSSAPAPSATPTPAPASTPAPGIVHTPAPSRLVTASTAGAGKFKQMEGPKREFKLSGASGPTVIPAGHAGPPASAAPPAPPTKEELSPLAEALKKQALPPPPTPGAGDLYEINFEDQPGPAKPPAPAGLVLPPPPPAGVPLHQGRCPNCGTPMKPEAVICLNCGLHLAAGQKVTTQVMTQPALAPAPQTPPPPPQAAVLPGRQISSVARALNDREFEPDHWTKEYRLPIALAVVGIALVFLNAFVLPAHRFLPMELSSEALERLAVLLGSAIRFVIQVPFVLVGLILVAKFFDTDFGLLVPFLIKITALALVMIGVSECVDTGLNVLLEGFGAIGWMFAASINGAVFFTLAMWLFDLDVQEVIFLFIFLHFGPQLTFMYLAVTLYTIFF